MEMLHTVLMVLTRLITPRITQDNDRGPGMELDVDERMLSIGIIFSDHPC